MGGSLLGAVATWPPANYTNPPTRGDGIIIASGLFGGLGAMTTLMRIYTRLYITRTFGADDGLIILALILSIAMMITMSIASARYGWDRHVWDIPFGLMSTSLKYGLVFQITFGLASAFTKLSLLWFCRRIIGDGRKVSISFHDVAISFVMFSVTAFVLAFVIINLVQCRPLKAYWDLSPTYGYYCINGEAFILGASIANTITDLMTTMIPVTLIATLHLPTRQRIAVMAIFGLGVLVNVAGAFRSFYVHRSMLVTNLDTTWVGWPTCISAIVEIGLGLIVASAPALRPLLNHYIPSLLESSRRHRRTPNYLFPNSSRATAGIMPLSSLNQSAYRGPYLDNMNIEFETFDRKVILNEIKGTKRVQLNVLPTFHIPESSSEDLEVRLNDDRYEQRRRRDEERFTRLYE